MYLQKSVPSQYGATASYWALASMQYIVTTNTWNVYLGGWSSEQDFKNGAQALMDRQFSFTGNQIGSDQSGATLSAIQSDLLKAIQAEIQENGSSDALYGAQLVSP